MRLTILFFLFFISLHAQPLNYINNYPEALATAKQANKPLLLYLYTPDCRACDYIDAKVIHTRKVASYITEHYIIAHLRIRDTSLPRTFRAKVSPVFHVIDPRDETMIESLMGGVKSKRFRQLLRESLSAYYKK